MFRPGIGPVRICRMFFIGFMISLGPCLAQSEITVKKEEVRLSSNRAVQKWDYKFKNLKDFVAAVTRPELPILVSGETKQLYCAFFRHGSDLLVVCWPRKGGRILRTSALMTDGYGATAGLLASPYVRAVPLVSTDVLGSRSKVNPRYGVQLFAESYAINPAYHGILKASITVWNNKYRHGAHLGGTVNWD